MDSHEGRTEKYWDSIAAKYRGAVNISLDDFHYGPLAPGDSVLRLLPECLEGLRCMELGCGRAQNSIFLARRGAVCTASDISSAQLEGAKSLAKGEGADVEFIHSPMERLPKSLSGLFDLVHSSYAIDFCKDQAAAVSAMSSLLKPGGTLILSTGHPLHSGEWLGLDDGCEGLFLPDYFNLEPETRHDATGGETVRSTFNTVSATANMLIEAGLEIRRICEPRCMDVQRMDAKETASKVPYWSKGWLELAGKLSHVPVVCIFKCLRRANQAAETAL